MTIEERICGEDGAPMRDAGIQPDGSRCLFVPEILGMFSLLTHNL